MRTPIIAGNWKMHKTVGESVELVKALLTRRPEDRLGSGPTGVAGVKKHPFFANVDWDAYSRREVKPPFKPRVEVLLLFFAFVLLPLRSSPPRRRFGFRSSC